MGHRRLAAVVSDDHGLHYWVEVNGQAVVVDSPLGLGFKGQRGIEFLREMPTVWDDSVVVSGEVAKSIVVARRAGQRWYLAAMNGEAGAELSVPLSFLRDGAWTLRAFADQPDGADAQAVIESTRTVDRGSVLRLSLAPGGGFAGIISPTKNGPRARRGARSASPRVAGDETARGK